MSPVTSVGAKNGQVETITPGRRWNIGDRVQGAPLGSLRLPRPQRPSRAAELAQLTSTY
jgi:hypothetical protein